MASFFAAGTNLFGGAAILKTAGERREREKIRLLRFRKHERLTIREKQNITKKLNPKYAGRV